MATELKSDLKNIEIDIECAKERKIKCDKEISVLRNKIMKEKCDNAVLKIIDEFRDKEKEMKKIVEIIKELRKKNAIRIDQNQNQNQNQNLMHIQIKIDIKEKQIQKLYAESEI